MFRFKANSFKVFTFLFFTFITSSLFAGELTQLLDKLVEKNILSDIEKNNILSKSKQETLTSLTQKISFFGDFRIRSQWEDKYAVSTERFRERLRLRLGGNANISKNINVKFGIVTGNGDSRSGNETFTNNFTRKGIVLDYAYVRGEKNKNFTNLGKIPLKESVFTTNDFLLDNDLCLEGINSYFTVYKNISSNLGYFILSEKEGIYPTEMLLPQLVFKSKKLKTYLSYFYYTNLNSNSLTFSSLSNANLPHEDLVLDAEYSFLDKEKFDLFSTYVVNTAIGDRYDKSGYTAGFKIGNSKKIDNFGDFEFLFAFRDLGKDAFIDSYPDVNFYSGKTDSKGFKYSLSFGLDKNIFSKMTYYDATKRDGNDRYQVFQFDLNYKF